jgi:ATP-dependent DNA helicase PIF1
LNGVPPASLLLKINGRYMITKNYDVARGVVNGTLIEMLQYSRHIVQVKLLTGTQKGRIIRLPRCSSHVSQENSGLPFAFSRVQFPIMPAYCVSVHKSQGQTLDNVGLWIDQDCFAHGQL